MKFFALFPRKTQNAGWQWMCYMIKSTYHYGTCSETYNFEVKYWKVDA